MKGIILTGGTGSRLMPLTKVINKNLLPLGNVPMIYHPIELLKSAGITEIMLVTGTEHIGPLVAALGSGVELGCDFTYKVQDKPNGIAAALKLCRKFIGENTKFAVILGDNIFLDDLSDEIREFESDVNDCKLFLKAVNDPERFGVAKLDVNDNIEEIIEKPKDPPTNFAVTGLYLYDSKFVFDIIDTLVPSFRGEYEISDVNCKFAKQKKCSSYKLKSDWIDAGTFESYHKANKLILGS